MSSDPINEILSNKLPELKGIIDKKIQELDVNRNMFNTNLTERLGNILTLIEDFKNTNFSELIKAKQEYDKVFEELTETKKNFSGTRNQLEGSKEKIAQLETEKTAISSQVQELTQQLSECNRNIEELTKKHNLEIEQLNQENKANNEKENTRLTQAHEQELNKLNKEKQDLEASIAILNNNNTVLQNKLAEVTAKQTELNAQLTQVITTLNEYIEQLTNINTNIPNIGDFQDTLDKITRNLSNVINDISKKPSASGYSYLSNPIKVSADNYIGKTDEETAKKTAETAENTYRNINEMNPTQFHRSINNLYDTGIITNEEKEIIIKNIGKQNKEGKQDQEEKNKIIQILEKYNLITPAPTKGGKRRRKTMKKRHSSLGTRNLGTRSLGTRRKRMKKHQKGGYTYHDPSANPSVKPSSNSSSNSSANSSANSSSNTNSNTKRKTKIRPKPRSKSRSRTKRRSHK